MRDWRLFGQSNVAASLSKTVISRANLLTLFYFRAFGCQPSRALRREEEQKSRRSDERRPRRISRAVAPDKPWVRPPGNKTKLLIRQADHGFRKKGE
ncbi:MAG TPA: hypothetical protein VGM44_23220 [Polyangiaceae bacterium]